MTETSRMIHVLLDNKKKYEKPYWYFPDELRIVYNTISIKGV